MQVLSSLSSLPFYAPSAGFAPTNSADVSAIASAYQVVSATATQLNAGTAYLTSVNETPISASRAGNAANASLANSAWYDGTGRFISSLPDEATVSGIASAYAESAASSKLDESASSSFYPTSNPSGFLTGVDLSDYATTAYVDSSVSSKLDTTAQVVTSVGTATSDVEGDTYTWVNGINGTSISAMTADVATHARTATYDSEGRRLTALAASSSLANYQTTANMSGYLPFSAISADANSAITSINGSSIGGGGGVDSATVSAIASAYADPKLDISAIECTPASAITAIGGSAIAGGGGGASIPFVGSYWDSAESATADITADVSSVRSMAYTTHNGTVVNTYSGINDTLGITHLGVASFIAPGSEINGKNAGGIAYTMAFAPGSSMWTTADAATGIFAPLQYGTGAGMFMDNSNFKGYLKGNEWFVSNTLYGYARGEVHQSRGSRVIVEHTGGAGAVLSAKGRDANVTLNSTAYGTAKMAVGTSQAYVQVQRGDSAYKYNSAKLDTDYLKFYNGMSTGYIDPEDTASGTSYLPAQTEYIYISSVPYWNAKVDQSAYDNLYSAFTALSDIISTYSGLFSSISSKVDNSAIGVIE